MPKVEDWGIEGLGDLGIEGQRKAPPNLNFLIPNPGKLELNIQSAIENS